MKFTLILLICALAITAVLGQFDHRPPPFGNPWDSPPPGLGMPNQPNPWGSPPPMSMHQPNPWDSPPTMHQPNQQSPIPQEMMQQFIGMRCLAVTGDERSTQQFIQSMMNLQKCFDFVDLNEASMILMQPEERQIVDFLKDNCKKRSLAFGCIEEFSKGSEICFTAEEVDTKNQIVRVVKQLIATICEGDGEAVEHFYLGDGHLCLSEHMNEVNICGMQTFSKYAIQATNEGEEYNPSMIITQEHCDSIRSFQDCVYPILSTCRTIAASNFFENLINSLRSVTICSSSNEETFQRG